MIAAHLAETLARRANMFCRLSANGRRLVFYTGTESEPGTWLEAGSTLIDIRDGLTMVSRNAVELITGPVA